MFAKSLGALCVALAFVNAAPIQGNSTAYALENRDYVNDFRGFEKITRTLQNSGSRIGVKFSSMMNIGVDYPSALEINPEDLVLLPRGYCYSCDTGAGPDPGKDTDPNPYQNIMAELNETEIIVTCSDYDNVRGPEWPLVRRCGEQERLFREYLIELRSRGNRLAVPKERLEEATVLMYNVIKCVPRENKKSCDPIPENAKRPSGPDYATITTPASKRHSKTSSTAHSTALPWDEQLESLESALLSSSMKGYHTWNQHSKVTSKSVSQSKGPGITSYKITSTHTMVSQSTSFQNASPQSAAIEPTITPVPNFPAERFGATSPSMVRPATSFTPALPTPSIDLVGLIAKLQVKVDYVEFKSPNLPTPPPVTPTPEPSTSSPTSPHKSRQSSQPLR
ncbi:hypothetical protein B7494_g3005 [Chlorociboria aeruginascens]|nr:hypothetical protein B7494_g3005 [Chlorociboria aeruginascens]